MFSNHPHRAPDARFEAVKNQLMSLERGLMDETQEVWTFINVCAQYFHAWHVLCEATIFWQLRRLDLKGESLDVRDACEQCGNVGGRPLVFCISMLFTVHGVLFRV